VTAKSRANLYAAFEDGDRPRGSDFEDMIDSFLSLTDTTAQSLAGNLTVPNLGANAVSAGTTYADNAFSQGFATHKNPYAEAYQDVTAITSVAATASWAIVSGALTAPNAASFTVSGHDLTYTGSVTAKFIVAAQLQTKLSANQNAWFTVAKNSAALSGAIVKHRAASGAAGLHQVGMQTVVELKSSDIINVMMQVPGGPVAPAEVFGVQYLITPVYWG
jgi:hypothetical protein